MSIARQGSAMSTHPSTAFGGQEHAVALVTGANHGIGAAIAIALAGRGADVAITSYRPFAEETGAGQPATYVEQRRRSGDDVVAAIEALGRRAIHVEADLVDPAVPAGLFERAEQALGPVSVLVHNASGWRVDSFAGGQGAPGVTVATIEPPLFVDARAGALLMNEMITRHRRRAARWGRIVTLTSGGASGFPGEASYGAAKAALTSYSLTAAAETAADGITVNVVHPPVTDTGWVDDDVRDFVARDHEHHHVAAPEEVAEVVAWLCADANHLVTGNVIRLR